MQELLDDFSQKKPELGASQNRFSIIFLFVQLIFVGIAVGLAFYEIETIVFSGPIGSIIGLVVFGVTYKSRLTMRKTIGLSAPIFSLICFSLIYFWEWSPSEAQEPIGILMLLYTIVIFILIVKEIQSYRTQSWEWDEDVLDF